MYTPHDDAHRQANRDLNRYGAPGYENSPTSNGGLVALLVVVTLIGGLIALSMLSPSSIDENGSLKNNPEATAPASISGSATTETAPVDPAE
ncbi:hypothetical protein RA2_00643 [Roseovarius sp. A-2]|uniref:hypothetical protein n=1 Tax=Roseovarius sp. A-2 TaxID=1570360 RepID=UPI0009B5805E|nr:hypothetical protein [Roseovarius sp. A-2]GAW33603.1 hypothetical protein RA2_00643 [Roseovarius sp. A-2]